MSQPQRVRPSYSIHWANTLFLTTTALVAAIGMPLHLYYAGTSWPVIGVFVFFLAATGLSITGGYHRLFAHRSYETIRVIKLFYLLFGAAACENSALKWATDHRNHHRFVDNDGDPYNIRRGFFHAHIGWILFKEPETSSVQDEPDLLLDPLVRWQHRFYLPLAISVGGGLPLMLGYFLGDALGCFLLAGVTRTVVVHHSTFLVNSLCHFMGKQPYSRTDSSRDSALVAFLTCGEGFHNFHHRFQYDYRNGVRWYHFDPTKWSIKMLETLRLAKSLRRASDVHIFKARLGVQREQAERSLAGVTVGFRKAMEGKIQHSHDALLSAYASWKEHRAEYRSVKDSMSDKRKELVLRVREDLRRARSRYTAARVSWTAVVDGALRFPGRYPEVS